MPCSQPKFLGLLILTDCANGAWSWLCIFSLFDLTCTWNKNRLVAVGPSRSNTHAAQAAPPEHPQSHVHGGCPWDHDRSTDPGWCTCWSNHHTLVIWQVPKRHRLTIKSKKNILLMLGPPQTQTWIIVNKVMGHSVKCPDDILFCFGPVDNHLEFGPTVEWVGVGTTRANIIGRQKQFHEGWVAQNAPTQGDRCVNEAICNLGRAG